MLVIGVTAQSQSPISISIEQNNQNLTKSANEQSYKDKYETESLKTKLKEINYQFHNQNIKSTGKQEHHSYDIFLNHPTDWLIAFFSFCLAWFTYRLWIATAGLWEVADKQLSEIKASVAVADKTAEAAKKSAEIAETTMIHSQRAYVFVKQFIQGMDPSINKATFIVVFENTGETPVKKMVCNFDYCVFKGDIPKYFTFPERGPRQYGIIGRKSTLDIRFLMPFAVIKDAFDKKARVFIYGWIDYDDVFPGTNRHRTESCHEIVVNDDKSFIYQIHGNYNGSDDECNRQPSPYTPPT